MFIPKILALCIMHVVRFNSKVMASCSDDLILSARHYTTKFLVKSNENINDIAYSNYTNNIYLVAGSKLLFLYEDYAELKEVFAQDLVVQTVAINNSLGKVYMSSNKGFKVYDEVTGEIDNSVEIPKRRLVFDSEGNYYYNENINGRIYTRVHLKGEPSPIPYIGGNYYNLAADNKGKVYGTIGGDLYHLMAFESIPQFITKIYSSIACLCFDEFNNLIIATTNNDILILQCDVLSTESQNVASELENFRQKLNTGLNDANEKYEKNYLERKVMVNNIDKIRVMHDNVMKKINEDEEIGKHKSGIFNEHTPLSNRVEKTICSGYNRIYTTNIPQNKTTKAIFSSKAKKNIDK